MVLAIEHMQLGELQSFLREQAEDSFPDLKEPTRLMMLSEKWYANAEFCTCRDDSGRLLGMVAFYANQLSNGVVYIPHIYVRSECRGKKIMTSMLQSIGQYAKEKGYMSLRLEVMKSNDVAQKAYKHYGFIYLGEASEESIYLQFNLS